MIKKILLLVMDGLGIGSYENKIYNSFANAESKYRQAKIPALEKLGLRNLLNNTSSRNSKSYIACIGKTKQQSAFCESFSAHREMPGVVATQGYSFSTDMIDKLLNRMHKNNINLIGGYNCYHNLSNISEDIMYLHAKSAVPVVVTSFQEEPITTLGLLSYEEVIPHEKLVAIAYKIKALLSTSDNVGRIVIKSFNRILGKRNFAHLSNRTDISIFKPLGPNLLDAIVNTGRTTMAAGKICGLFNGYGFTHSHTSWENQTIFKDTLEMFNETCNGLVWTNFNSLDRPYGHSKDVKNWIESLELFDSYISEMLNKITRDDLLIITGDHGCDPVLAGFHTKEWNPLLVYNPKLTPKFLSNRNHSDIAATIADCFNLKFRCKNGKSFYNVLKFN